MSTFRETSRVLCRAKVPIARRPQRLRLGHLDLGMEVRVVQLPGRLLASLAVTLVPHTRVRRCARLDHCASPGSQIFGQSGRGGYDLLGQFWLPGMASHFGLVLRDRRSATFQSAVAEVEHLGPGQRGPVEGRKT